MMRVVVFVMLMIVAGAAQAADKNKLRDVEAQLEIQKQTAAEKAEAQKDAESKLYSLRDDLVSITRDVQTREKALLKVQEQQKKTEKKIAQAKENLGRERKSLAQMILALQRLDRLPPQALLARPSAPIDTARSYHLLQNVLPKIAEKADQVKIVLDELASLRETQEAQQKSLKEENEALVEQQTTLKKAVAERKALFNQTAQEHADAERKARTLAQRARDLRDLLTGLGAKPSSGDKDSVKGSLLSWFSKGSSVMPVVGRVETGYGDTLPGGGTSQGLQIAAAKGAVVTAPMGGIVKFAGPFRQYKLLVILQHGNGEHSLLGGLQELYTRVGETVVAGEPIGKLSGDSMTTASLYYERRHGGKPIDPRKAR